MPDADIAALQAVRDEICADVPASETATRERVAAKLREAACEDCCSLEDLRRAGPGRGDPRADHVALSISFVQQKAPRWRGLR
jgi:hypothetical protein